MSIKEPILFITVEDFKSWKGFDKLLFENVTNSNENIWFAISVASSNIDYLSGFAISKKWPEQTSTIFTDNIQTATAHYVRFLCTKGVDYTRGQASMAQGGIVYSETNPQDPYYIPPEVFNYLRSINEYTALQGFNLNVKPKSSFFSKFLSNKNETNPLENYLEILNLTSSDPRVKIKLSHSINLQGTVVDIDTTAIKSITTIPELKSPKETININYDKKNNKINIDISNKIEERILDTKLAKEVTMHLADNLNPNTKKRTVDYEYFDSSKPEWEKYGNGTLVPKMYVDYKVPNLTNYYKKEEINDLLNKKQDILNEGNGIWIKNLSNIGFQIGINKNEYYDVEKIDILLSEKQQQNDDNLKTTSKSIVDAINELVEKINNIPQWKVVGQQSKDKKFIQYELKLNKRYRIWYQNNTLYNYQPYIIVEFFLVELPISIYKDPSIIVYLFNKQLKIVGGIYIHSKNKKIDGISIIGNGLSVILHKLEEL